MGLAELGKASQACPAPYGTRAGCADSVQDPARDPAQNPASTGWQSWGQLSILVALLALLYFHIVYGLVLQWWTDPNYSHGFIIPVMCAGILWKERKNLAEEEGNPAWLGLILILGALGVLVLGVLGAELFLSRTSLIFLLAGLVIQFRGFSYFRRILFPWGLLFLAVPLPDIVFNRIAVPLQFLSSWLASGLLVLSGVPVLREGNVINLPSLSLNVVEACSGLRSLVSLITLAILYGFLFERRTWVRVLLAVSAIPISVAANGFRIMGSGLLGEYWDPTKAEGFFHLFTGWLIFAVSLLLLVSLHSAIDLAGTLHEPHEKDV
jgi:exosortase